MRNVLVFPDGNEVDFKYPVNRKIEVGEKLEVTMQDDSVEFMFVKEIKKEEDVIYYILELS